MKNFKNTAVDLLLLVIFCIFTCAASARASYGETCHKELRCDTKAMLSCFNGTCQCLMSDTMVFEENDKKCVSLAGEKCVYTATEGDRSWSEQVECISNSKCVDGLCACDLEYFELGNGSCAEKSSFGGPCSQNSSCQQYLSCGDKGTCECEENRIFDDTQKACVHLAGMNCATGNDNKCVSNAMCEGGKCTCLKTTYFQRENGTCEEKHGFGGECTSTNTCASEKYLDCQHGICKCVLGRTYDDSRLSCLVNSGNKCLTGRNEDCVKNANCEYGGGEYTCKCQPGFRQDTDDTCLEKQVYKESCNATFECNEQSNFVCNLETGKCGCKNETLYHPSMKMCTGKAESYCTRGETCVPNGVCWGSRCQCGTQYDRYSSTSIAKDGYCYVNENEACNTNADNFEEIVTNNTRLCQKGLVCSNYTCACYHKYHQVYNKSTEKCASLVGGPCNDTVECVENAECVTEDGLNVCRCKSRFSPIKRKCEYLAYGENCSQDDTSLICDIIAPLSCSVRGRCECRELQVYDEKLKICRGLAGAACGEENCRYASRRRDAAGCCVDGATCNGFRGDDGGSCICKPGFELRTNRTCISPTGVQDDDDY